MKIDLFNSVKCYKPILVSGLWCMYPNSHEKPKNQFQYENSLKKKKTNQFVKSKTESLKMNFRLLLKGYIKESGNIKESTCSICICKLNAAYLVPVL